MLGKLIKLRLKGFLARQSSRRGKSRSSSKGTIALYLLLFIYAGGFFGAMFYNTFLQLGTILRGTDYAWFFFAMAGLLAFGLSLLGTVFVAKSELFEAKDNELLLSMPIRPRDILLSRMTILLAMEYLFSLLVLVPAGLAWFGGAAINWAQLGLFIGVCLLLPLASTSIACLFGWLIALLTARSRHQSIINIVLSLVFLGVYFIFVFRAQTYFTQLLESYTAVAESVAGWGFLFHWLGAGITGSNYLLYLAFSVICLVLFFVAVLLLSRSFFRIVGAKPTGRRKKKGKANYTPHSPASALLRRERKHFFGSATYLINCALGPILCLIAAVAAAIKMDALRGLIADLSGTMELPDFSVAFVLCLAICFITLMGTITAPSISLEGKSLWILRSLPISSKKVLDAKLKLHLYFALPPSILLSVVLCFVLQGDILTWLLLLLLPQAFLVMTAMFGLVMNLLLPRLDWTNETYAVKQSMSVLLALLLPMGFIIIAAVVYFAVGVALPPLAFPLIFTALTLLLSVVFGLWLSNRGVKRFERL